MEYISIKERRKKERKMEYMNDKVINLMTKKAYDCAMLSVMCLNL